MNLKNNKGITGVDLSVALIIIVLFAGIISSLIYNYAITSKSVNRKSEATNIAIQVIEDIKDIGFNGLEEINSTKNNSNDLMDLTSLTIEDLNSYYESNNIGKEIDIQKGYSVIISTLDYTQSTYFNELTQEQKNTIQANVIKIPKATVEYTVGNRRQTVDLSTTIVKED